MSKIVTKLNAAASVPPYEDLQEVKSFVAGGAIDAGACVMWDIGGAAGSVGVVVEAQFSADHRTAIGVAVAAAASGEPVQVVVGGYVQSVLCDAGVGQGDLLKPSIVQAGLVGTYSQADTARPFAVALEAEAGGTIFAYIFPGL